MSDLKERKGQLTAFNYYSEASRFLEDLERIEADHNVEIVKERLKEIDKLVQALTVIGLAEEMNPHIEPVRKVISRAIEGGNIRLAEILGNELFGNVDRLLFHNYLDILKSRSKDLDGVILRLKGLGVDKALMLQVANNVNGTLTSASEGRMMEILYGLADLSSEIDQFTEKDLPGAINEKMAECGRLLAECETYGIEVDEEKRALGKMEPLVSKRPSIDLLEESFHLERDLDKRMKENLRKMAEVQNSNLKKVSNEFSSRGAEPRKIMDAMTLINRSEVLLESGQVRQAYEMSKQALASMDKIGKHTARSNLMKKVKSIRSLLKNGMDLGLDLRELGSEVESLPEITHDNVDNLREGVDSLLERVRFLVFDGAAGLSKEVDRAFGSMVRTRGDIIPAEMKERLGDVQKKIREAIKSKDADVLYPLFTRSAEVLRDIRERIRTKDLMERCSVLLEVGFDIKDEKSSELMARAQALATRIQAGDLENVEADIADLEAESESVRTIVKMGKIEELLRQIGDLDDLAIEVFAYVKGKTFDDRERMLQNEIEELMDISSSVYESNDLENVDTLLGRVGHVKASIMDLDSEWRAGKKMEALSGLESKLKGPILKDLVKLREAYSTREWAAFFSMFDRFQAKISEMDKVPAPVVEALPEIPTPRPRTGPRLQRGSMGGIGRIASEAFSKRMKMESAPSEPSTVDLSQEESTPLAEGDERNLSGIAKLIAGSRIEALKKVESEAVDPTFMGDIPDNPGGERARQVRDLMDDFIDLDTTTKTSSTKEDIERIKTRLETLFTRMPPLEQLEDAKGHYAEGCKHMESGKSSRALKEFRTAISSAVKVCKLHADIGKALQKLKVKMEEEGAKGVDVTETGVLLGRASMLYRSGNLEETPKVIREIAERLKKA